MDGWRDVSIDEIPDHRIAKAMGGLTEEQHAALCRGEAVFTPHGTLFPMLTKLPGAEEPMLTCLLSYVTGQMLDDRIDKRQRFLQAMMALGQAATAKAKPAVKELVEAYLAYDHATDVLLETLAADYQNVLTTYGCVPALTIRAMRGSAANKRHANTPASAARAAMREIWPEANRNGWTADKVWSELTKKGHGVKADTVRKWMTKLRKTGTC